MDYFYRTVLVYIILSLVFPIASLSEENLNNTTRVIKGTKYLLLDEPSAKEYLTFKLECPKLKLMLEKKDTLLVIKNKEIQTLEELNINDILQKEALEDEVITLHEQQMSANAWYRSPYLWTAIGLLCGIGLTLGVLYGVQGEI